MAIKSYVLGEGTFTLTLGPEERTESAQVTKMKVQWDESVTTTDAIPVLSGEELPREESATYAAKLVGEVLQDGDAAGLVAFTWNNRGEVANFEFIPAGSLGTSVTGTVRIAPLEFGGDELKKRPVAPVNWSCPTDPVLI